MKRRRRTTKNPDPTEAGQGWAFGPFELSIERGLLVSAGAEISISPKPLAALLFLVRNRERVVSRAELLEAVWPDVTVSDAAFASVLRDLRRALGDTATESRFVATLRGRGLRFVAPVRPLASGPPNPWDEAQQHLEQALRALQLVHESRGQAAAGEPASELRERGDLLVALARARWSGGSIQDARETFLDAASEGRLRRDGAILARAALGFAGRTDVTPGVNREAVALLEEALTQLPPGDSALRAEVMARLGTESYYADVVGRAMPLTADAVAMAERVGDSAALAYALTARNFVLRGPEESPTERLSLSDRAIALTAAAHDEAWTPHPGSGQSMGPRISPDG